MQENATLASRGLDKISYDWFHLGHCFSYVKQAIMCAGDATLEYPTGKRLPGQNGVDGLGVPHYECRDIGVLDTFIDKHEMNLQLRACKENRIYLWRELFGTLLRISDPIVVQNCSNRISVDD